VWCLGIDDITQADQRRTRISNLEKYATGQIRRLKKFQSRKAVYVIDTRFEPSFLE